MLFRCKLLSAAFVWWTLCFQSVVAQPARPLGDFGVVNAAAASSLDPTLESPFNKKYEFTAVNGIGYFLANDTIHGIELWRTDGTAAGTWMVVDLNPGEATSLVRQLTPGETLFYFTAESTRFGYRLFRSDGTEAGTYPVRDELPIGTTTESLRYPLVVQGDQLYFSATVLRNGNNSGLELWTTDGSRPGTRLVKEIGPGTLDGVHRPDRLRSLGAMLNGNVLFSGQTNSVQGFHLWASDGTAAGTRQLKHLVPPEKSGSSGLYSAYPTAFISADTLVYFTATSSVDGEEWWRTDGTAEGTFILPEFAPEQSPNSGWGGLSGVLDYEYAVSIGHSLVYAMQRFEINGSSAQAVPGIAYTDGTVGGTKALRERLKMLTVPVRSSGKAWFIAQDVVSGTPPEHLYGLWVATAEGCHFVTAVTEGSRIMAVGNQIYCQNPNLGLQNINAQTEQVLYGGAVWNAGNGTWSVPSPLLEAVHGEPMHFGALGSQLFFSCLTPEQGREPWVTDGTPAGTHLLKDINQSGANGLDAGFGPLFLESENTVYFPVVTPTNANKFKLLRLAPEMSVPETVTSVTPAVFVGNEMLGDKWGQEINDGIVFSGDSLLDNTNQYRAHIIRGNEISILASADGVSYGVSPHLFTRSGSYVYFFASDPATGGNGTSTELWRTAGTPETTIKLKSFLGTADTKFLSHVSSAATADGRFFFWINEDFTGATRTKQTLWSSDGSAEGTVSAGEYWFSLRSNDLYLLGNGVIFKMADGVWFSNGTEAGTAPYLPGQGVVLTETLEFQGYHWFIAANPGGTGNGLWRTDGTVEGTYFVTSKVTNLANALLYKNDIYLAYGTKFLIIRAGSLEIVELPLPGNILAAELLSAPAGSDYLYFRGIDPAHGAELWRTDGTTAGTIMRQNINPGPNQSYPSRVRQIGANVFFAAFDNTGLEPWIMPLSTIVPAKIGALSDRSTVTGQPFNFQPTRLSGSVDVWQWSNLPPGLNYDPATGAVTGIPQAPGTFLLTVDACNGGGVDTGSFKLRVTDPDYARVSLSPVGTPGKLSLSLSAIAGLRYHILTSTDLIHWDTVTEDANADFTWPEVNAENGQRFYQVLTVNPR